MSQDRWYEQDTSNAVNASKKEGMSLTRLGCGCLGTLSLLLLGGAFNMLVSLAFLPAPKISVEKDGTMQVVGSVTKDGWTNVEGVGRTYTASVQTSYRGWAQEVPFAFVNNSGALRALDDLFDPGDYVSVRFRNGQKLGDGTLVLRVYGVKEF